MFGRAFLRKSAGVVAGAAVAAIAGGGCSSVTLRAADARTPILLGNVACMGCGAERARGATPPTITGGVHEREYVFPMFAGYASGKVSGDREPLDVAATRAVTDPCREDVHVSSLRTGTWSFDVPLLFGIGDTWVDVQASDVAVANGACGRVEDSAHKERPTGGRREGRGSD
jgi:hypothetical protein